MLEDRIRQNADPDDITGTLPNPNLQLGHSLSNFVSTGRNAHAAQRSGLKAPLVEPRDVGCCNQQCSKCTRDTIAGAPRL
jgi:hypothetical protein